MVKLNIFDHIRANVPSQVIEFETIQEARDAMLELDCYDFPAEVNDGRFICRNYPNLYALSSYEEKRQVEELYNARDPKWEQVYRPAY